MIPMRRTNWLPSVFNDFFGDDWIERSNSVSPAVNIIENDQAYVVEVAAPGLTKNDFHIDLHEGNRLVVSMEKKTENEEEDKDKKYLRREFSSMNFSQSLILPDDVEQDKIEAKVNNGVLSINIPKKKIEEISGEPKRISIQ